MENLFFTIMFLAIFGVLLTKCDKGQDMLVSTGEVLEKAGKALEETTTFRLVKEGMGKAGINLALRELVNIIEVTINQKVSSDDEQRQKYKDFYNQAILIDITGCPADYRVQHRKVIIAAREVFQAADKIPQNNSGGIETKVVDNFSVKKEKFNLEIKELYAIYLKKTKG